MGLSVKQVEPHDLRPCIRTVNERRSSYCEEVTLLKQVLAQAFPVGVEETS